MRTVRRPSRSIECRQAIRVRWQQWHTTGSELGQSYFLTLLAEALASTGQLDTSLALLNNAQAFADQSGEKFWQAEIYRIKGEILLQTSGDNGNEAETCFNHAMEVASQQKSKSLELRAAMSLADFYLKQKDAANTESAYSKLKGIYNSFSEGFDTSDLEKARRILKLSKQFAISE